MSLDNMAEELHPSPFTVKGIKEIIRRKAAGDTRYYWFYVNENTVTPQSTASKQVAVNTAPVEKAPGLLASTPAPCPPASLPEIDRMEVEVPMEEKCQQNGEGPTTGSSPSPSVDESDEQGMSAALSDAVDAEDVINILAAIKVPASHLHYKDTISWRNTPGASALKRRRPKQKRTQRRFIPLMERPAHLHVLPSDEAMEVEEVVEESQSKEEHSCIEIDMSTKEIPPVDGVPPKDLDYLNCKPKAANQVLGDKRFILTSVMTPGKFIDVLVSLASNKGPKGATFLRWCVARIESFDKATRRLVVDLSSDSGVTMMRHYDLAHPVGRHFVRPIVLHGDKPELGEPNFLYSVYWDERKGLEVSTELHRDVNLHTRICGSRAVCGTDTIFDIHTEQI